MIRHILFVKILRVEIERAYRPKVVRPLRLGGRVIEDPNLHNSILVYFALILAIFIWSWIALVAWEPDSTWTGDGCSPKSSAPRQASTARLRGLKRANAASHSGICRAGTRAVEVKSRGMLITCTCWSGSRERSRSPSCWNT